jgi:hypothetical protein
LTLSAVKGLKQTTYSIQREEQGYRRTKLFLMMPERISLLFYKETKQKWGREEYNEFCSTNERTGLVWMKAGI